MFNCKRSSHTPRNLSFIKLCNMKCVVWLRKKKVFMCVKHILYFLSSVGLAVPSTNKVINMLEKKELKKNTDGWPIKGGCYNKVLIHEEPSFNLSLICLYVYNKANHESCHILLPISTQFPSKVTCTCTSAVQCVCTIYLDTPTSAFHFSCGPHSLWITRGCFSNHNTHVW